MNIENQRLIMTPITISQAQQLMVSPESYPDWLKVKYDSLWPDDGLKAMLPIYVEALENDGEEFGFGPWIILHKHKDMAIGDIGFKGKPVDGVVEIGYFISNIHRNQGYAKEAIDSMVHWAFSQDGVETIAARCTSQNVPSCKVLEANGFKRTGEQDGLIVFEAHKKTSWQR